MSFEFEITNQETVDERIWRMGMKGQFSFPITGEKYRLMLIFQSENVDRRFPFVVQCQKQGGITQFQGEVDVQIKRLFFEGEMPANEDTITLKLALCTPDKKWEEYDTGISFSGTEFQRNEKRDRWYHIIGRQIKLVFCTLLIPFWIVQGAFALKGLGWLHPTARNKSGKKVLFYHANGMIKKYSGYSYSVREYKTNFFKKQYEKFCKKYQETEGILCLSERRLEAGSNMDLVRKALQKTSCGNISEFINTTPIHALPKEEIRKCAELVAKSKVIILEDFYPQLHSLHLRPDTKVIQLWHACGAYKLFGLSALGKSSLPQRTRNHRNYSMAITSSQGIAPIYSEAFGVPMSHIKPVGVPRTDVFFDEAYEQQVKENFYTKYPVCRDKKVVMFAPTFRGAGNKSGYYPEERFPIKKIMEKLGEDVVLIVKHHPFVKRPVKIPKMYADRVIDLSKGENINDLLFVTDLLITDYSSCIFEASILKVPVLFYAFDLEEYLEARDIYFDFSTYIQGKNCRDVEELVVGIKDRLAQGKESGQDEIFREFFVGAIDGKSTQRVVGLVQELMDADK